MSAWSTLVSTDSVPSVGPGGADGGLLVTGSDFATLGRAEGFGRSAKYKITATITSPAPAAIISQSWFGRGFGFRAAGEAAGVASAVTGDLANALAGAAAATETGFGTTAGAGIAAGVAIGGGESFTAAVIEVAEKPVGGAGTGMDSAGFGMGFGAAGGAAFRAG